MEYVQLLRKVKSNILKRICTYGEKRNQFSQITNFLKIKVGAFCMTKK